jgi:hypothetical protein
VYRTVGKRVDKVSSRLVDWSPVDGWTGCLAGECTKEGWKAGRQGVQKAGRHESR